MGYQAWAAIQAAGEYSTANWVVKLDADAVMIPSRLKYWLSDKYVPPEGIYLENCKYVKYGWFGSLEIFSKAAFETLLGSMASCKNGVKRGIGYGSKLDGTCEADRPLEEKKNKKWKPNCDTVATTTYHPL